MANPPPETERAHVAENARIAAFDQKSVAQLKTPTGWVKFGVPGATLQSAEPAEKTIFRVVAGEIAYSVDRDADLKLHFHRSTPGTGTRVATIDLSTVTLPEIVEVTLEWRPSQQRMSLAGLTAEAVPSSRQLRVTKGGEIVLLGDVGIEIVDVTFFAGGGLQLRSTAIESWRATIGAIETVTAGLVDKDHHTQSIGANLSIVMLAAGLEAYARRRFSEIEGEGFPPNEESLAEKLFPAKRREEILADYRERVTSEGHSFTELVAANTDLGNWDRLKSAFSGAYGIGVGGLVPSDVLVKVQNTLKFRNHIVHVSPLALVLDESVSVPSEDVMSGQPLLEGLVDACDAFVEKIHEATVALGEPGA